MIRAARRSVSAGTPAPRLALIPLTLLLAIASPAHAQEPSTPTTIPEMWNAWCSRCHAQDGTGKVAEPTVTVEPMDFTDCSVTSPEGDSDWEAVIIHGGPVVGLSSQMPAFGDVLKPAQVSEFVAFLKTFCVEKGWPNGNLNLPRPLFAEKAFPENEFILAPVASHRRGQATEFELAAIYERRIGRRGQVEGILPFGSVGAGAARNSGAGDVEVGFKFALNPMASNHLVSAGFDVVIPTGRESRGLGGGAVVFEPYLATATVIGSQTYLQTQLKFEFARGAPVGEAITVYNIYVGRDAKLLPSTFTYGVELTGENDEVALAPQIRKGLSKSGALAGAFGVRIPINKRDEQGVKWVAYLLWEYLEPVLPRR